MRQILFKAKSIDKYEKGKWVEGYVFDDGYENGKIFIGNLEIQEYNGSACDDWDIVGTCFYEIDPDTLCQYTGLIDKNGNKIWENDVVEHEDLSSGRYIFREQPMKNSFIKWNVKEAKFERSDGISLYKTESTLEVIGNIFDNSELIKSEFYDN